MFSYQFIQNALLIAFVMGILLPTIGVLVMLRRMTFIADSFGHINMTGIAFSMFISSTIPIIANFSFVIIIIWTVISAILIEYLREKYNSYKETSIIIVYSFSIALTMIFLSLSNNYNASIISLLFGNINAISTQEVRIIVVSSIVIIGVIIAIHRKLLVFSLDEEHAHLYNINTKLFKYLTMILIAIVITISIKVVGVLLVSALLVIPLLASSNVNKSLLSTWFVAVLITEVSIISGIIFSYKIDISTSAIIVLGALLFYIVSLFVKKID